MEPVNSTEIEAGLKIGQAWPLGAQWTGHGVNFAVFSAHAQAMDLCLFDVSGSREMARWRLPGHSGEVWHGYLPGAGPGLTYGLRAHGPWRPESGHCFNPAKLLLDPYARELVGTFEWREEHFGMDRKLPLRPDARDNATHALKARVVDDRFDWGDDQAPHTSVADTVIYEVHVKGFSKLNSQIPEPLRGTYAGLAHGASVAHLKRLGVTAISLLPIHYCVSEERLQKLGLRNYWGYNTLGFFCVDPRLASLTRGVSPREEFCMAVKNLHRSGIEVYLDVVFNHTAESDETGPTLSFRGLDNAAYYRLRPESPIHYENQSGCGNTLDIRQPRVLQLVMDCLRYWAGTMHVDGFRFDLAPVLGRNDDAFNRDGAFFTALAQDPILSRVKMIAEPWDMGPGGYQVGGFPRGWLEWNDKFRDTMRSYWVKPFQPANTRGDFALRLCASSDLYQARQRSPSESINYVASHDGFTLLDLVSYKYRHNLANGENNRDGHTDNLSFNCGVEGPTENAVVNTLRSRLQRALLATTLLAQGTPMLCSGDELGHSQNGNNNPYCLDNETTWIAWAAADDNLIAFTSRVLALRHQALPFDNHWYSGLTDPLGLHDLAWLQADGTPLQDEAWQDRESHLLGCLIGQPGRAKAPLLLLVNADQTDQGFMLPAGVWQALLDTAHPRGIANWYGQGEVLYTLAAHSLVLLAAAGADIRTLPT
jgi:glycogen debranching enzyme GlgX